MIEYGDIKDFAPKTPDPVVGLLGEGDARQQAADERRLEQIRESALGDYYGGEGEGLTTAVDDVCWLLERDRLLLVRVQELTDERDSLREQKRSQGGMADKIERLTVERDEARRRVQEAERALREGIEAFRLTREYVGEELLPATPGWSWFDWVQSALAVLGDIGVGAAVSSGGDS